MKKYFYLLFILVLWSCTTAQHIGLAAGTSLMPLIPLPEKVVLSKGNFSLHHLKNIRISSSLLQNEANMLLAGLNRKGFKTSLNDNELEGTISLKLNQSIQGKEAYQISVTPKQILVQASDAHGIFNGIQTLLQSVKPNGKIESVEISDSPAFAVRGYMIDVGRNYQSMQLIKLQIDKMAEYKLNVLHFHATEDVAWRFESKKFPQLTAAGNMARNKGQFYSVEEMKELFDYCKKRHITFIPEIDMPGHSAAFVRAMKVDMQTEKGGEYMKEIVDEFINTYRPEYIHIGGDEVKITNKNFLPEMVAFIQSREVKTVGWSPGGNFGDKTIRQLWMDDNGHKVAGNAQFIDSRHLYINHMDPLESVTTIFNRQIGDTDKGNTNMLGAILCNWPDRRLEKGEDAIIKNPVFPSILAFAERTWRGGGEKGWVANIGQPGEARSQKFAEFENRLLVHKEMYFQNIPFPYQKQQDLVWNLYGPYNNEGDLSRSFNPERRDLSAIKPYKQQIGGTVVLRHWWNPLIAGAIDEVAKENSTWYATTRIWSDKEGVQDFWIGFNNISRSPATDSPPVGQWDQKKSKIWVNGTEVAPPVWKRGGLPGDSEIPLVDEGYEYRKPTPIYLKKGWNQVLIKSPVGTFKGKNWQNPVKWMFTFVPVR